MMKVRIVIFVIATTSEMTLVRTNYFGKCFGILFYFLFLNLFIYGIYLFSPLLPTISLIKPILICNIALSVDHHCCLFLYYYY